MNLARRSHAVSRTIVTVALHDERPSLNARRIVAALARIAQLSICLRDHACMKMKCASQGFILSLGLVAACQ